MSEAAERHAGILNALAPPSVAKIGAMVMVGTIGLIAEKTMRSRARLCVQIPITVDGAAIVAQIIKTVSGVTANPSIERPAQRPATMTRPVAIREAKRSAEIFRVTGTSAGPARLSVRRKKNA